MQSSQVRRLLRGGVVLSSHSDPHPTRKVCSVSNECRPTFLKSPSDKILASQVKWLNSSRPALASSTPYVSFESAWSFTKGVACGDWDVTICGAARWGLASASGRNIQFLAWAVRLGYFPPGAGTLEELVSAIKGASSEVNIRCRQRVSIPPETMKHFHPFQIFI